MHFCITARSRKKLRQRQKRNYPMDFSCTEATWQKKKKEIWIEPQWILKCVNKLVGENLFFRCEKFFPSPVLWSVCLAANREKSTEMLKYVWNTNIKRMEVRKIHMRCVRCSFFFRFVAAAAAAAFSLNRWEKSNRCIYEPLQKYFHRVCKRFVCAERQKKRIHITNRHLSLFFPLLLLWNAKWYVRSNKTASSVNSLSTLFDQIFAARAHEHSILFTIVL